MLDCTSRRNNRIIPLLVALIGIAVLWLSAPAGAHPLNNGYSELTIDGRLVRYELFLPEIRLLHYDKNKDGKLTEEELAGERSDLIDDLSAGLTMMARKEPMALALNGMTVEEKDSVRGVTFHLTFEASERVESFMLQYNLLFDEVDPDHVNFAVVLKGGDVEQAVFDASNRSYYYDPERPAGLASAMADFAMLGVRHIWEGTDHLLFVLSLVLVATRLRDIVRYVTAFTVAHSITLFLAAAGLVALPSVWVESLIAVTILYVALENIWARHVYWRTVMTFAFGLVHGLGFASALGETGLPEEHYIGSLIAFNVGVEAGQLAFIALLLPALYLIRKKGWQRMTTTAVSAAIAFMAVVWLLQRTGLIGG